MQKHFRYIGECAAPFETFQPHGIILSSKCVCGIETHLVKIGSSKHNSWVSNRGPFSKNEATALMVSWVLDKYALITRWSLGLSNVGANNVCIVGLEVVYLLFKS